MNLLLMAEGAENEIIPMFPNPNLIYKNSASTHRSIL